MKAGKNRIFCNNCEDENGTDEEEISEDPQDMQRILIDIQKKVSAIPIIKKHLDTIQHSISMLSDKYDTLLSEQEIAKEKIMKLEKLVNNANNKCVYLEKCNLALEQKVHEFDQKLRKHNLEIIGIDYLPNENLREVVSKIGEKIGVGCDDIEWVRRSHPYRSGMRPPAILIGFKTSGIESRDSWLVSRYKLKDITCSNIIGGQNNSKIYINEDLTKTTRTLFYTAKKELHGNFKYIWVNNGKILVKKLEGDKAIWLKSESEISDLLKK